MKWRVLPTEPGVWHGGQFYPSKDGVVDLPDHVDLSALGYKKVEQESDPQKAKKVK